MRNDGCGGGKRGVLPEVCDDAWARGKEGRSHKNFDDNWATIGSGGKTCSRHQRQNIAPRGCRGTSSPLMWNLPMDLLAAAGKGAAGVGVSIERARHPLLLWGGHLVHMRR